MKTVQMLGGKQMEVVEVPEPEPGDDLVVVKVMASTICGTEAESYQGEAAFPARYQNAGHEAAGVVWRTDTASGVREGDRVAIYAMNGQECGRCRQCLAGNWILCLDRSRRHAGFAGTHAQFVLRREQMCFPLPESVSFEVGAVLLDCVGTPYRAIKRLGVSGRDTVLITGMGPVGAAAAMICRFLGARVIAAEVRAERLALATKLGVDYALNPASDDVLERVREVTEGRGVEVAIDCTGLAGPQVQCLDAATTGGRVALVGVKWERTPEGRRPATTPVRVADHLLQKELTLIGSWYLSPSDYPEVLGLVERGLPVESLITHRFGIGEASAAFGASFDGGGTKVIIDPWG